MVRGERTRRLALRLMPEEADVVTQISVETGLTLSDVVRLAIRSAHANRFKAKTDKKPKK